MRQALRVILVTTIRADPDLQRNALAFLAGVRA